MKLCVARNRILILILTLAIGACGMDDADSKGKFEVGLRVDGEATPADAGLPMYPGSKPYKEADQSSSGANVGFSTPFFGLKVVATNLETPDAPERVAVFYKEALSKYGIVVECVDATNKQGQSKPSDARVDELTCDSNQLSTHKVVYKVGTKKNQRIVAIKPHGSGARFSLVHVNVGE